MCTAKSWGAKRGGAGYEGLGPGVRRGGGVGGGMAVFQKLFQPPPSARDWERGRGALWVSGNENN
jgi:hypothetical protein